MSFKFYSSIVAQTEPVFIDKGNISQWVCNNTAITGKVLLDSYKGGNFNNIVYAPRLGGKTVLNRYNVFAKNDVQKVDFQYVPFNSNIMENTFANCKKLNNVVNINKKVTSMPFTFLNCNTFNQNIILPSSVVSLSHTFERCYNFNQNIKIPNNVKELRMTFYECHNFQQNILFPESVTAMYGTFFNTYYFNQNVKIPNNVTDMYSTFFRSNLNQNIKIPNKVVNLGQTFGQCHYFNQNVQIPNSVTFMDSTFAYCHNLNQNIQIPKGVTTLSQAFSYCNNLTGRINILSTELMNTNNTFYGSNKAKQVYFYYKYANGVYTKTYNCIILGNNGKSVINNYKWQGKNGVTCYDLGKAPW